MDTPTEDFILIDAFLKNKLDANAKEEVLKRLSFDDAFYQDFQLWTNLDDWLVELPAFEIRQALRVEEVREIVPFYKKTGFIYSMACSVLLLIGFGWYFISKDEGLKELSGQVKYLVKNTPDNGGSGFGSDADSLLYETKDFIIQKSLSNDTTYTFKRRPFELIFKMPKIKFTSGEGMKIIFDYSTKKYEFYIGKNQYHLEETKQWKKLERFVK